MAPAGARLFTASVVAIVLAVALASPGRAADDRVDDIHDLLDRAEELEGHEGDLEGMLDELLGELDGERAELARLTDRLTEAEAELKALDKQLQLAEAELAEAEERYERAREHYDEMAAELAAAEAELEEREEALREQLVSAYKYGGARYLRLLDAALSEESVSDAAASLNQLAEVAGREHENVQRLSELHERRLRTQAQAEAAREQRDEERDAAARLRDGIEELRDEQEEALRDVEEQRAEQEALVEEVESDADEAAALLEQLREDLTDLRAKVREVTEAREEAAGGVICPVPAGAFINDWHFPRSGGRVHEGNDIFADRGEPIYATSEGTVRRVNRADRWRPGSGSGLGGKTVSVTTDEGTWWYYAHLDEIHDDVESGAQVEAGQKIGTVGTTGNARHTPPHLHLGLYVDGEPRNPYPLIDAACR